MAQLQIAVDLLSREQTVALADQIHDVIDIFEVGTPVIVRDGMQPVRQIKERHPGLTVLADVKIIDGGYLECADACKAGADIVTVLAIADDATVRGVVEAARQYGRKVMADLIRVEDIAKRSLDLLALGVDYLCVHTAVDVQSQGRTPLDDLTTLVSAVAPQHAAAAGGINGETLEQYLAKQPAIVVMGGALCSATDVRAAVMDMQERIKRVKGM